LPGIQEARINVQWHPRIPKDKFPIWLKENNVVHFIGTEPTAHSHSVHILFHEQFQDAVDRYMILPCLRIGHTIALFTPDNGLAVSAITYVESVTRAIVLFFATHNWFQCIGHGAFLLDLVFHVLRSSYKGKDTSVFLKAIPEDNAGAYNWYSNRGFKKLSTDHRSFHHTLVMPLRKRKSLQTIFMSAGTRNTCNGS
jgi:hypothetical protein